MNPFTTIRDVIIIGGLALVVWLIYRAGLDHASKADIKALQVQILEQGRQVDAWKKQATEAQKQLNEDMAAIGDAAAHPVVHSWVCPQSSSKPTVLPAATTEADHSHSTGGSIQPGAGSPTGPDPRDLAVSAFKARWEESLASCRALDRQWPSSVK